MKPDKAKTIFRVKREKDFTIIPDATLRDRRLSFKARGVLAMILSHSDSWVVTNKWLQSQGTEGREAIKLATDELKKFGYAQFDRTSDGVKFTNVWTFYDAPVQRLPVGRDPVGRDPVGRLTVGRKAVVHSGKPEEPETIVQETIQQDSGDQVTGIEGEQPELPVTKSRHREPAPPVGCAQAEQIYKEYPRKVARPKALKCIATAIRAFGFDKVYEATKLYAASWEGRKDEMQFCPHPSTWYNQERFNDDPSTWARKAPTPRFNRPTTPFGNSRLTEERMRELRRGNL